MASSGPGSITVGTVSYGYGVPEVYVDGQLIHMPNVLGEVIQVGQSVTVMRLGNGRYQMLGLSGYWGPPPP